MKLPDENSLFPILDWQTFDGKEYHFNSEELTYATAKKNCEDIGGKLAEPREQATNDFFTDVANQNGIQDSFWFGINDISDEGVFVYESNNVPVSWTNWASNEPNNGPEQGDCVRLKNGKWCDLNCDSTRPSVCEKIVQSNSSKYF